MSRKTIHGGGDALYTPKDVINELYNDFITFKVTDPWQDEVFVERICLILGFSNDKSEDEEKQLTFNRLEWLTAELVARRQKMLSWCRYYSREKHSRKEIDKFLEDYKHWWVCNPQYTIQKIFECHASLHDFKLPSPKKVRGASD